MGHYKKTGIILESIKIKTFKTFISKNVISKI